MPRFAQTRETPEWARQGSLLEEGGDFGFGWGFGDNLLGGLPSGAREIVGQIWGAVSSRRAAVVIAPTPATPAPNIPSKVDEEPEVAHDWGHLGRQVLGGFLGAINDPAPALPAIYAPTYATDQFGMGQPVRAQPSVVGESGDGCDGATWAGGAPPKGYKVVNYCGQGVLRKIRRRRRRRILSASDASDIATIVGLVGKGQMASALINRTRG